MKLPHKHHPRRTLAVALSIFATACGVLPNVGTSVRRSVPTTRAATKSGTPSADGLSKNVERYQNLIRYVSETNCDINDLESDYGRCKAGLDKEQEVYAELNSVERQHPSVQQGRTWAEDGRHKLEVFRSNQDAAEQARLEAEAKQAREEAAAEQTALNEAFAPVQDEGFTNPVHEAHAGEIVFSKRKVDRANPNEGALATQFKLGDPIWLRAYLKGSFENNYRRQGMKCIYRDPPRRLLRVFVNGSTEPAYLESKRMHEANWTDWTAFMTLGDGPLTRRAPFQPDGEFADEQSPYTFWSEVVPQFVDGNNTVRFEVEAECSAEKRDGGFEHGVRLILATGEITIASSARKVRQLTKKFGPKLPRSKQSRGVMSEMKKTITREWPSERVMAVSAPNGWQIERHRYHGYPVRRFTDAWIVVQKKGENTCRIFNNRFSQQANGRRFNKSMSLGVGSMEEFPCP